MRFSLCSSGYVAAAGLPTARREHAVVMARFARDCMFKMWELSKELEVTLGPESGHLSMRMGIHSGPVTAGILRGDRARFQLFGYVSRFCFGLMRCLAKTAHPVVLILLACSQ